MKTWTVTDFKPYEKGTLKGFFALVIGDMRFEGFSLHEKDGSRWVSMPSREYQENGERKFAPTVSFTTKERRWAFQKWALGQLDKILPQEAISAKPRQERVNEDLPF